MTAIQRLAITRLVLSRLALGATIGWTLAVPALAGPKLDDWAEK